MTIWQKLLLNRVRAESEQKRNDDFIYSVIELANELVLQLPNLWYAMKYDGSGRYRLGVMTEKAARDEITKDGAHKIKFVDHEKGFIYYD